MEDKSVDCEVNDEVHKNPEDERGILEFSQMQQSEYEIKIMEKFEEVH